MSDQPSSAPTPVFVVIGIAALLVIAGGVYIAVEANMIAQDQRAAAASAPVRPQSAPQSAPEPAPAVPPAAAPPASPS